MEQPLFAFGLHTRIEKSWRWLINPTSSTTYTEDGYAKVSDKTTTSPPENMTWLMAWTCEALLLARTVFKTLGYSA
jgi:hypothetical protein